MGFGLAAQRLRERVRFGIEDVEDDRAGDLRFESDELGLDGRLQDFPDQRKSAARFHVIDRFADERFDATFGSLDGRNDGGFVGFRRSDHRVGDLTFETHGCSVSTGASSGGGVGAPLSDTLAGLPK